MFRRILAVLAVLMVALAATVSAQGRVLDQPGKFVSHTDQFFSYGHCEPLPTNHCVGHLITAGRYQHLLVQNGCAVSNQRMYKQIIYGVNGGIFSEQAIASADAGCGGDFYRGGIFVYAKEYWITQQVGWHVMAESPVESLMKGEVTDAFAPAPCNSSDQRYWSNQTRIFWEDNEAYWYGHTSYDNWYLDCLD